MKLALVGIAGIILGVHLGIGIMCALRLWATGETAPQD